MSELKLDMVKVEILYGQRKKSMAIAYLLGFLLGGFGAHYFYCDAKEWGLAVIALFVLTLLTGGALGILYGVMVMLGFVHTYFIVEDVNKKIRKECEMLVAG